MPRVDFLQGEVRLSTIKKHVTKGGLGSRYKLRGDFDIQVDASITFLDGRVDVDQVLMFLVEDESTGSQATIGVSKHKGRPPAVYSWCHKGERRSKPKVERAGDFNGGLRITREGRRIKTFLRKSSTSSWRRFESFSGMDGDVAVGLVVMNLAQKRKFTGKEIVVVEFDNFLINAAQSIVPEVQVSAEVPEPTGCDKAHHYLLKGKITDNKKAALNAYLKAIMLCPGYIRPYELAGNLYREQGQKDRAIRYFEKAADLGTANYKLYYLLAKLLFEKGDLDGASRHLKTSLRIRGDYAKALDLEKSLQEMGDTEGPTIVLYEPSTKRGLSLVQKQENLTVRGLATDKSGVAWVRINDQAASLGENGNFLKDIPIRVGENTIVVKAADKNGNESSISVTVKGEEYMLPPLARIDTPEQAEKLYGSSYAVVIGINQYDIWPALEFAVADAEAVKKMFEATGFDEVFLILDKEATQRRILTELFEALPQRVKRNDRVVFYFAGHGQTEDLPEGGKQGYIIPVDAGLDDFTATAISMEQIRSLSRRIPAKHILYVMDSCYSGLGLNRSVGLSSKISDYLRKIGSMRAVQIITAGGKGEQVQEKGGHGLFTTHLLEALGGKADLNKDNVVTGTELGAYLRPTVSNASNQAQTPLYGRLEGEGEFLFFVKTSSPRN
jgi:tetratricopeptide (TPR) repeat protein